MAALFRLGSICCAPLLFLALAVVISGSGNYVYYYGEPDFFYLVNSVTILDSFGAHYIDHPGLPLEWLGALVLAAFRLFRGHDSGLIALAEEPRAVFLAVAGLGAWLFVCMNFVFGWFCLRKKVPLAVIVLAQLSPLFFPEFFHLFMRITPETLIFTLGFVLASAYIASETRGTLFWCGWGVILGTLVSLKATTWPCAALVLLPLFDGGYRRLRHVGVTAACVAIVFVFFFLPAWDHWPRMTQWMLDVWFHSGQYGQGDPGVATFSSLKNGLHMLWHSRDSFLFLQYLGFTCALTAWFAVRSQSRLWVLYLTALLFGLFVVVKHPHPRYLAGLSPLLLCMLLWAARERRKLVMVFLIYFFLSATPHLAWQVRNERLSTQMAEREEVVIRELVERTLPSCSLNYLTQVTERSHVLYVASMATEEIWLGRALNEKFPRTAFWSPFSEKVYRYDQFELDVDQWRKQAARYSCHLFFVKDENEPWLRKILNRPLSKVALSLERPRFNVVLAEGKL